MNRPIELLKNLFNEYFGEQASHIAELPLSGSDRKYLRMRSATGCCLGVYNPHPAENKAYLSFTEHFIGAGLAVPKVFIAKNEENIYLVQDMGDETLFSHILKTRNGSDFPPDLIELYKKVIHCLPEFQVKAGRTLDYSVCHPRASFDKQSMMWDLNYFKYYFLKLAGIPYDEQGLEDDFETFTAYLLQADQDFFLYRDFQSRNILIYNNQPWFIDFQGGRRGALQYDLASLLYDAKANIPQNVREQLLDTYLGELSVHYKTDIVRFKTYYYGYVLIRIMQAMGAYGFRGYYEKKEHFLQSIPYALNNLSWLLHNTTLPIELPTLLPLLEKLTTSDKLRESAESKPQLIVGINSFSFKRGVPVDESGNGGGFVFDCRALNNPGRYQEYVKQSGQDSDVVAFLAAEPGVELFLSNALSLVKQSIGIYRERGFRHLMVNFGCTGGQHRSVYCAERIAVMLQQEHSVKVELRHRELEMKAAR
jgi:aminoglycoside/choline kinase family phosphotransferase